jgi:cytoskeletal protein CcmA (bactofilin family)
VARRRRHVPVAVWVIVAALPAILAAALAFGQETRLGGKLRAGEEIVITSAETVRGDLYAFGGDVRVEGSVEGDLVAMAGQVQVSGTVEGDLMAGSGNVHITGQVEGDARIGAGQVTVDGLVGEDLFTGAGQVTITSSGEVGEDFVFGSGQTTLDGRVGSDVLGSTGAYTERGSFGGSRDVTVARREERTPADVFLDALQRLISILVVAALLLWLLPRVIYRPTERLKQRPWLSLGVGALGVVGAAVLIAAVVLVAVLLGIALGLLQLEDLVGILIFGTATSLTGFGFALYLALGFVAYAVVGLVLGRLVVGAEPAQRWWALSLGVLGVVLVSLIPAVGGFLAFVISVFGFGALILEFWPWRPSPPPPPPPPPPARKAPRRKATASRRAPRKR